MKIVPGHTRLYRRGAVYYHRCAVPTDLRESYGKREELISLKTRDYAVALKKVRRLAVEVDKRFEAHRQRLKPAFQIENLTQEAMNRLAELRFQQIVTQHEKARLDLMTSALVNSTPPPAPQEKGETDADQILDAYKFKKELDTHRKQDLAHRRSVMAKWRLEVQQALKEAKDAYTALNWEIYASHAANLLKAEKIHLSENAASFPKLCMALLASEVRGIETCLALYEGAESVEVRDTPAIQADIQTAIGANDGPLFSEESSRWVEDQLAGGRWKPKTARAVESALKRFEEFAGDRGVGTYAKADARGFRDLLLKLPANARMGAFKGLNVLEAVELAEKRKLPPMSRKNASKMYCFVASFFRHACAAFDEVERSPFEGLSIQGAKRPEKVRASFTSEELTTIFKAPIYTGCESPKRWWRTGGHDMSDTARYWVPLLGCFTGCRLAEIVQLELDDIREQNGIHYLDINASGDKTLKTASSTRKIPIHPKLIELGFLKFVKAKRKTSNKRLFYELERSKADGTYSFTFSKWFSRFLKESGVKTKKNCFHSFRHSFEDACRAAEVSGDLTDALQGHKLSGMRGVYGDGFKLETLAKAVRQITFSGLDLSFLHKKRC